MKIESVAIKNMGDIRSLKLSFIDGVNVICGASGLGKTMILDIIENTVGTYDSYGWEEDDEKELYSGEKNTSYVGRNMMLDFSFDNGEAEEQYDFSMEIPNSVAFYGAYQNENKIEDKKAEQYKESAYQIEIDIDKEKYHLTNDRIQNWLLYESKLRQCAKNLLYVRTYNIDSYGGFSGNYQQYQYGRMSGSELLSIKRWFVAKHQSTGKVGRLSKHRFVSVAKQESAHYKLAIRTLSILDSTVMFKSVVDSNIVLKAAGKTVLFDDLSNGYKSCVYIIWEIIRQIENINLMNSIYAENFDGVVLIPEIELHLHPIWQVKLVQALKLIFPKVQFIMTTHSPSVLQILKRKEIIALASDENGNTYHKKLNLKKYGVQGWTVEEISENIMGMPATTSKFYENTWKKFDRAMNLENKEKILEQYEILRQMLHPNNILLKLLLIQIAEWKD